MLCDIFNLTGPERSGTRTDLFRSRVTGEPWEKPIYQYSAVRPLPSEAASDG